ncbi:MAG: hypothetical protein JNL82_30880 [Myxococcales bacterium]|nr:hypothetical protein [Myxococcales bacterium]
MAARPTKSSRSSAPERLLLAAALAACSSDAPLAETSTTSTTTGGSSGEPSTGAPTTGAPTTGEFLTTTGELDCGGLTRCGVVCVDLDADPDNCGDCGVSCFISHAAAVCSAGACGFGACEPGYADCNDELADGCETALARGESCPLVCAPRAPELCNLFDDDCDAACDEDLEGCRLGVHRGASVESGRIYSLDPAAADAPPFTLEHADYFRVYAAPSPGLVPYYHCLLPSGQHYYTTSDACDDIATVESTLGHVADEPLCGAVPLYRLSNGPMNNYLYTVDPAERDDAILNLGYMYEAVAAHVWIFP